jgi:putative protein-disulfide isomerase
VADEELQYGFDPLCGWCFAFGPTIRAIATAHPDLPIRLRRGGLVVGERVAPIAVSRDYLINGLAQVQRTAGVSAGRPFYDGLLAEGTYVSDSEPPCRAITVMEQIAPAGVFGFAVDLPDIHYVRGLPLDDADVLAELAASHGADADEFRRRWLSDEARAATEAGFADARTAGFTSYPTLIYRRGTRAAVVARGFLPPVTALSLVASLRAQG